MEKISRRQLLGLALGLPAAAAGVALLGAPTKETTLQEKVQRRLPGWDIAMFVTPADDFGQVLRGVEPTRKKAAMVRVNPRYVRENWVADHIAREFELAVRGYAA